MANSTPYRPLRGSLPKVFHHLEPAEGQPDGQQVLYAHIVVRSRSDTYPDVHSVRPGKFLSGPAYTERYGADPKDIQAVRRWYEKKEGLDCEDYSVGGRLITLSGTLEQFSRAFRVTFRYYKYEDRLIISHEGNLSIPAQFAGLIKHIGGLSEILPLERITKLHLQARAPRERAPAVVTPEITSAYYARYYHFPEEYQGRKLDGKGMTFAIIALGGDWSMIEPDVLQYAKALGLPRPKVKVFHQKGYQPVSARIEDPQARQGALQRSNAEVATDLEVVLPLIPRANFQVYFAKNDLVGLEWALTTAAFGTNGKPRKEKDRPTVISLSWNFPEEGVNNGINEHFVETYLNLNEFFIKPAVMLGITFVTCSGDWGSSNQSKPARFSVSCPASSPYTLAVGGTFLEVPDEGAPVEQVWNQEIDAFGQKFTVATGGGFSKYFQAPDYQQEQVQRYFHQAYQGHPELEQLQVAHGIPDVAAVANSSLQGYYVVMGGQGRMIPGGTSASTPLWGALIVKLAQALGTPLGNITPWLYEKAAAREGCLHPVSLTGEATNCLPADTHPLDGQWKASPGWNPCAGLGSPNGTALLALLAEDYAGKQPAGKKQARKK